MKKIFKTLAKIAFNAAATLDKEDERRAYNHRVKFIENFTHKLNEAIKQKDTCLIMDFADVHPYVKELRAVNFRVAVCQERVGNPIIAECKPYYLISWNPRKPYDKTPSQFRVRELEIKARLSRI